MCHPTAATVDFGGNAGMAALLFVSWERRVVGGEPSAYMYRRFDRTTGISLGPSERWGRCCVADWYASFPEATSFPRLRK